MSLAISPWGKMSKQQVRGFLKGAGSKDEDVLFAKKEEILAIAKLPKSIGIVTVVLGVLLSITIIMAMLGIPMIFAGWWLNSRGKENVNVVEAAYSEYLANQGT
jgi:hypothetical protein